MTNDDHLRLVGKRVEDLVLVLTELFSVARTLNVPVPFRSYRSLLFWILCVFEPPFGGLGTTYDVHLGLIGKRVVDFLLVLIELFSLGVTAEALQAKIDRKSAILLQRGHFDPVSYTHLRAHETVLDLVCRLLLEILGQTDRVGPKSPIFDLFSPVALQP